MKLRIGHLSTFYHTAILLIADDMTNKRLGADVEWRLFGTGPAIVNAFENGELDLAYIGLPPVIIGIDRGVAIKCIAGGHMEGTVFVGKANHMGFPEINTFTEILKQFNGLKIGVPGKCSIHDIILRYYLEQYSLEDTIEIVNFSWADFALEAFVKNIVSAVVGTPALAAAVKYYAEGKILYPPSMLWTNNPSYGIIVSDSFLNCYNKIAEDFLVLHENATLLIGQNSAKASEIISNYIGFVDKDIIMDTFKISPKYCAQITDNYISSTMKFVPVLKNLGYASREIAVDKIFDTSIIKKTHPEKDHYG